MAKTRYWQATVAYPGGRTWIFGVRAASLPAALLKVYRLAAGPGIAGHITVTRLYGPHHPLYAATRAGYLDRRRT